MQYLNRRESEDDNIEYKSYLCELNDDKINRLASQLLRRVDEGGRQPHYIIGLSDGGKLSNCSKEKFDESVINLEKMVNKINCNMSRLSLDCVDNAYIAEYLIREKDVNNPIEIKIGISGGVDCGKSTTLGCLVSGEKDDGNGRSRSIIFNHPHELKTGRTTSIAHHLLGFASKMSLNSETTSKGFEVVNYNYRKSKTSWTDILTHSDKIISFYDLAGHEKYLKTTIMGLSSSSIHVCFIMIGANMGITNMTKEHIFLCLSLNIPFCFIITKIDLCANRGNILNETITEIKRLMNLPNIRKNVIIIENSDDALTASNNINSNNIAPVFKISNITFEGVETLLSFMNSLHPPPLNEVESMNEVECYLDCKFNVKGIGLVIGGELTKGKISVGDKLYIGPNKNGDYKLITIRGIHYKRTKVDQTSSLSYHCFNIKDFVLKTKSDLKGLMLVDKVPVSYYEFDTNIKIQNAGKKRGEKSNFNTLSTSIKIGYEPTANINNIRQTVKLIKIIEKKSKRNDDSNVLMVGDIARVRMKFRHRPQYIKVGDRIVFSEGFVKAIGSICAVHEYKRGVLS
jgi:elongation factor 1-alpha